MSTRAKKTRKDVAAATQQERDALAARIAEIRARDHYLRDEAGKRWAEAKLSPVALPGQRAEYFRLRAQEFLTLWEWQKLRDERILLQLKLEAVQD